MVEDGVYLFPVQDFCLFAETHFLHLTDYIALETNDNLIGKFRPLIRE
jgi:hypothetical protein